MNNKKYTEHLRLIVLENSLLHEFLITRALVDFLEIDINKSLSFGDKSSSLSLSAKINLLLDLNILDKAQKAKLVYYLEIRNKFLHNWKCKTFEDCFKTLESTYSSLQRIYKPSDKISKEQQMLFCYNALGHDIVDIAINHVTTKVIEIKAKQKVTQDKAGKVSQLRRDFSNAFLDILSSDVLKGYKITEMDKMKILQEFMKKII